MHTDLKFITMRGTFGLVSLYHLARCVRCRYANGFTAVEIGSYAGQSTEVFARYANKVYAVDPWLEGYDTNDVASQSDMKLVEKAFDDRMRQYPNVKKLKMTSAEAVKLFKDQSIDFVYIDGEHSYDAVKFDIQSWLPKIKSDGIIAGHDYCEDLWAEVYKAVRETIGKPDLVLKDTSWVQFGKNTKKLSVFRRIWFSVLYMFTWVYLSACCGKIYRLRKRICKRSLVS